MVCYIDVIFYNCIENVVKILFCGYEFDMLCYEDVYFVKCKEKIIEKRKISFIFDKLSVFCVLFYKLCFYRYKCDYLYIRCCYEFVKKF